MWAAPTRKNTCVGCAEFVSVCALGIVSQLIPGLCIHLMRDMTSMKTLMADHRACIA